MQIDEHLARRVSECERELAAAHEAYNDAKTQLHGLQKRRGALQTERERIIAQRTVGNMNEPQETRLAVLAADLEGLGPIIKAAETDLKQLEPARLQEQLDYVRQQWRHHESTAKFEALAQRAREIEGLLMDAIGELWTAGQVVGKRLPRECFQPTAALRDLVVHGSLPANHGQ
ncbi:MAG: hypothetical protein ACREVE_10510 [Gammaproteobacteria bacterium]